MENKYGLFGVPSKSQVNSNEFLFEYKKQSKVYKNYNIQYNIGNEHYKK